MRRPWTRIATSCAKATSTSASRRRSAASTSTTCRRSRAPVPKSAPRFSKRRFRRACATKRSPLGARSTRRQRHRGRRPLVRDGRGLARCVVRRPAGYIPQRERRAGPACRHARGLRLAVQRSRDRVSRAPGIRSLARRIVGRRAAHGAQRSRRERRDVHARYRLRVSATSCSSRARTASARPSCKAP